MCEASCSGDRQSREIVYLCLYQVRFSDFVGWLCVEIIKFVVIFLVFMCTHCGSSCVVELMVFCYLDSNYQFHVFVYLKI